MIGIRSRVGDDVQDDTNNTNSAILELRKILCIWSNLSWSWSCDSTQFLNLSSMVREIFSVYKARILNLIAQMKAFSHSELCLTPVDETVFPNYRSTVTFPMDLESLESLCAPRWICIGWLSVFTEARFLELMESICTIPTWVQSAMF